uniref:NADH dehydrogenase subunit 4 n=1 Tax=Brueelia nebulosa TaxID=2972756 RepID=UPI0023AB0C68|nr:NADH dehydrogenase subunit 4 [Brueelia nebulosa]WCF77115.1 NADH dehydrogenase subunit 4 [Brueelia nebulosa]
MVWSLVFFFLSFFFKNVELKIIQIVTIMIISKLYISSNQAEFSFFFLDSMSMNMAHLSILLSCFTLLVYLKKNDQEKSFLCLASGMVAFVFFHSSNLLFFFILFEASLIPLVILIIGWGKQPERILASKFIMIYTLFSSFPLFCFIVWAEESVSMYSMCSPVMMNNYSFLWPSSLTLMVTISFIMAFLVKVPMFFVHSWLTKAHVEASLEGSIILAGVMLKVGIYGIFRLLSLFPSDSLKSVENWMFCVSIIGSVVSILMAISSDDLKMSIALSSVSHMNFLLSGLVSMKEFTSAMANFTMISHGFSASILFFFVTIIYEKNNSRSLALVKGSMSKVPSILLLSFLFFSLSIALPPSLPFLGEMLTVSSIWAFSMESILLVCVFILFNSFFSMMNYGVMNQSAKKNMPQNSNFEMNFNFISMVSLIILIMTFFFPEMVT